MKKNNLGIILGVLAAVVIIALAVLLILSYARKPDSEPGFAAITPSGPAILTPGVTAGEASTGGSGPEIVKPQISGVEIAGQKTGEEKFAESMIRTDTPSLSEEQKLEAIDFENWVFRPVYKPAVSLTAESGLDSADKTAAPWTCIATPDDQTKTFTLSLSKDVAAQTSKIIWQVSLVPFNGGPASASDKPGGLLLSGELSGSAKSFTVDFAKVYAADYMLRHPAVNAKTGSLQTVDIQLKPGLQLPSVNANLLSSLAFREPVPLRTYYVRAFPVDSSGKSIGDGGAGLPVLYGDPLPAPKNAGFAVTPAVTGPFSLLPAKQQGAVYYNTEFPNDFRDMSEAIMYNAGSKSYSVLPTGFPDNTEQLVLQVSLSDFTGDTASDWNMVPGLVFEKKLTAGDAAFRELKETRPGGIAIDFSSFVPADSALPEKESIRYYVRAVALTSGGSPGTAEASYSETIVIKYGKMQASDIKIFPQVKINPRIPVIEKLTYTPVHWEAQNWQYHYVVTYQPTENEVFPGFGSNELYGPFTPGVKLDFTPQPENKSWWEKAWDAIKDFFKSLVDFVAKIVNWVSKAYADLKAGLINIVVSALPDSMQGPLRAALTAMVDYGLAAMGIPPSLPNFDDLANMGADYLATVALQQAGLPADAVLVEATTELAGKIGGELTKSAASSPNPMNWNFVKLDPDYLYKPAYLTLELYNPYDEPTPAGKLSFTADKYLDLTKNGSDPVITHLYAAYGSPYVYLYKPVYGMEIPPIAPGQRLTVPVILEEYVNIPFPGCQAPVKSNSFKMMYNGLGKFSFSLSIAYDLPPVGVEARNQGHTEEAIYSYSSLGNGASFSIEPGIGYSR